MSLTCPIPEEQNTRGRRIHDPKDCAQMFGLLLPRGMPAVPAFPIYTRSGEVLVTVELVKDQIHLSAMQLSLLYKFHMFTFSSVLRLEKYPMVFSADAAQHCVVVAPLTNTSPLAIDWQFLDSISFLATRRLRSLPDEERQGFTFKPGVKQWKSNLLSKEDSSGDEAASESNFGEEKRCRGRSPSGWSLAFRSRFHCRVDKGDSTPER